MKTPETMTYKSISILLASFLTFFVIMAATDGTSAPPRPRATAVITGNAEDIRDFIISKTKEGYQLTHLSSASNYNCIAVMSKF